MGTLTVLYLKYTEAERLHNLGKAADRHAAKPRREDTQQGSRAHSSHPASQRDHFPNRLIPRATADEATCSWQGRRRVKSWQKDSY